MVGQHFVRIIDILRVLAGAKRHLLLQRLQDGPILRLVGIHHVLVGNKTLETFFLLLGLLVCEGLRRRCGQ